MPSCITTPGPELTPHVKTTHLYAHLVADKRPGAHPPRENCPPLCSFGRQSPFLSSISKLRLVPRLRDPSSIFHSPLAQHLFSMLTWWPHQKPGAHTPRKPPTSM